MSWTPDHESGDDTSACPYCQRPIYQDSPRCPYCGNYISAEDSAPSRSKPWWVIIGALAGLYAVYRWIFG